MSDAIEDIFYKYLVKDATLAALLGATGAETKISEGKYRGVLGAPHVELFKQAEGSADEILDDYNFMVKVTVGNYDMNAANIIKERLKALLDIQSAAQVITGDTYFVCWCKHVGGTDDYDDDTKEVIKIMNFTAKFRVKSV